MFYVKIVLNKKTRKEELKMKKATALMMSIVLFLLTMCTPALATDVLESASSLESQVIPKSDKLSAIAQSMNVHLDEHSTVQALSAVTSSPNAPEALMITNTNGSTVTKDILVFVTDESTSGSSNSIINSLMAGDTYSSIKSGDSKNGYSFSKDYPLNGTKYVVHGTAVYDYYRNTTGSINIYHPIGAYFTYKKNSPCNISNICLSYATVGSIYSIPPGNTALGKYTSENPYLIKVNKSNPETSTMYSTTREFTANRGIALFGTPDPGNYLTFTINVDGREEVSSSYSFT